MNDVINRFQTGSRRTLTCASAFLVLLVAYGQVVTVSAEDSVTTNTADAAYKSKVKVPAEPEFAEAHVNQDVLPDAHVNQDDADEPPEAVKGRPLRRTTPIPGDVWINVVPCPGDIDGDGVIAFEDMFEVLSSWGNCGSCPADVDDDGNVNMEDLSVILNGWGQCVS